MIDDETFLAGCLVANTFVYFLLRLGILSVSPKPALSRKRPPCGEVKAGEIIFTDPDGRRPQMRRKKQKSSTTSEQHYPINAHTSFSEGRYDP
jgi:hypothetical protein